MKTIERKILLDWWLQKFHNTTVDEVIATHSKETLENADWFKLYPVTQEQEDEWVKWAKSYIKRTLRMGNAMLERQWPYVFLDCSPYVKNDE